MEHLPPPLPARPTTPAPANPAKIVFIVLMWLAWAGVIVVSDFLGFMMFAFADSPGSANAAKLMIVPAFIWFGVTFVVGGVLLFFRKWWTIVPAFLLAVSPPFLIFAGYNLLAGAGNISSGAAAYTPSTAPVINTPQGGFRPAPMTVPKQPDFRAYFPAPATQPASRPSD